MLRLGLESLINSTLRLVRRVGGARSGRKVLTLVATILAGGFHIDHANRLRAGATQKVLPFRVTAPSTLGTFLRSFTFGHIRQLDRVIGEAIGRAWSADAGPGDRPVTVDLDSTIWEVHGKAKQGAAYGYTRVLATTRWWPPRPTPASPPRPAAQGVVAAGAKRFVEELVGRLRRAGESGRLTLRGDSSFWSLELIDTLRRLGVRWSITVPFTQQIQAFVEGIDEKAWTPMAYRDGGEAQVAETIYVAGSGRRRRGLRLVVHRSRLTDPAQLRLWPNWRHHAFVTDVELATVAVDRFHRDHATVELAIRDLKEGAGMVHCPSGRLFANAAWLACAVLAHNLIRWTAQLGGVRPDGELTVAGTGRGCLLRLPGRLVNRSGRFFLRLPRA